MGAEVLGELADLGRSPAVKGYVEWTMGREARHETGHRRKSVGSLGEGKF